MIVEWEIVAADEEDVLEERTNTLIKNVEEEGYEVDDVQVHYSGRNIQWEALITFRYRRDLRGQY